MLEAGKYASVYTRSVSMQIEHWARIGKIAEENPDLPYAFIRKSYKKLYSNQLSEMNNAINEIMANPEIGDKKQGDLSWLRAHKFKMLGQLAYAYVKTPDYKGNHFLIKKDEDNIDYLKIETSLSINPAEIDGVLA
jgi:hypothetical protein